MPITTYENFDLLIEPFEAGYRVRVINAPAGEATGAFDLPFSKDELRTFGWLSGRAQRALRLRMAVTPTPAPLAPKEFGIRLFAAAFADAVGTCLMRSLDAMQKDGKGLRLRLRFDQAAPELAELPWEYLYSPMLNRFVVLSGQTIIARYLELPQPQQPLAVALPLRILALIAAPNDAPPLNVDVEWQQLQKALDRPAMQGLVTVERLEHATLAALQDRLRQDAVHILHYMGHGYFDADANRGGLLLEAENGCSQAVDAEQLATLLHDHPSLRLVFLNACEGARSGDSDCFAGIAQKLVQQGIPAVIAMQFAVSDRAAITLAQEFYEAVADGYPVDAALAEARKALSVTGNEFEWGTPVLFSRAPDNQLWLSSATLAGDTRQPTLAMPIQTAGGAVVQGDVSAGGDFVGRDKITIVVQSTVEAQAIQRQLQEREEYLKADFERQPFEPETVLIPGGPFLLGSEPGEGVPVHETPRHEVILPPYRIGKYPVTNGQYAEFIQKTAQIAPYELGWPGNRPDDKRRDYPVVGITWFDALAYCQWLSRETTRVYTLPSEAQWEKAARGRDGRLYPWGNAWEEGHCNRAVDQITPVQAYPAQSVYGCFDLVGNSREWTCTLWGEQLRIADARYAYPWADDSRNDLTVGKHIHRIYRGGAAPDISQLRCSARNGYPPDRCGPPHRRHGLRVVMII